MRSGGGGGGRKFPESESRTIKCRPGWGRIRSSRGLVFSKFGEETAGNRRAVEHREKNHRITRDAPRYTESEPTVPIMTDPGPSLGVRARVQQEYSKATRK